MAGRAVPHLRRAVVQAQGEVMVGQPIGVQRLDRLGDLAVQPRAARRQDPVVNDLTAFPAQIPEEVLDRFRADEGNAGGVPAASEHLANRLLPARHTRNESVIHGLFTRAGRLLPHYSTAGKPSPELPSRAVRRLASRPQHDQDRRDGSIAFVAGFARARSERGTLAASGALPTACTM